MDRMLERKVGRRAAHRGEPTTAKVQPGEKQGSWLKFIAALFLSVVAPTLIFFVAPLTLEIYDDAHKMSVTCRVTTAYAEGFSSTGGRGGASSGTQVIIDSRDCGFFIFREGVNGVNAREVADSFVAGDVYVIEIGEGSYKLRDFLKKIDLTPSIYGYRHV